jgi:cytochrome b561
LNQTTYDNTTIRFHWLSALLIVALWIIGQSEDLVPKGPLRSALWSTHFTLGGLLALLLVGRLVWRFTGARRLPEVGSPLAVKLAKAGHGLLYLTTAVAIGLGVAAAMTRGASVWGLFNYPQLIGENLKEPVTEAHELAANLLLALGIAHGLVAVVHQYVLRDGVLARMLPRLTRG